MPAKHRFVTFAFERGGKTGADLVIVLKIVLKSLEDAAEAVVAMSVYFHRPSPVSFHLNRNRNRWTLVPDHIRTMRSGAGKPASAVIRACKTDPVR